jgi:arginyl-tRNA synthetase
MTFRVLLIEARELISKGLTNLGYPQESFEVSEPGRQEFGDVSSNVAFQLGKKLKEKPYSIALRLVEDYLKAALEDKKKNRQLSLILSVEAHPAGYVNFKANYENLAASTLGQALGNPLYGFRESPNNEGDVIVEHTSVNPNKALHVGHLRNAVLGDSIFRILKATSQKVTVLNYVDDSGLQVADIVVAFKFAGFPLDPPNRSIKFDHYTGDEVYVKINELYEGDRTLEEKRRFVLKEIESGESELARFAREVVMRVLREQLRTCWRMNVRYDLLNFESQIVASGLWEKTFGLLKDRDLIRLAKEGKNKGCWVLNVDADGVDEKVVIRSDLTTTYIAKDIPYAAWKLGIVADPFCYYKFEQQWDNTWLWATTLETAVSTDDHSKFNPGSRAITIIDSRQSPLQKMIAQVLSQFQQVDERYHHLAYEPVTLSPKTAAHLGIFTNGRAVQMSGRKGLYVNADFVIERVLSKAYEEVRLRNPHFPEKRLNKIAEAIAVSAIRYNLIKYDLDRVITFDIVESLSLDGDTGPYLQYAYARSRRLVEKSAELISEPSSSLMTNESEAVLLKLISKLDLVVEDAARTLNPKSVARYAHMLATAFNLFYEQSPILKEKNEQIRISRLALVKAFLRTLRNTFYLLGLEPLNEM